jgi:hypothetical protein
MKQLSSDDLNMVWNENEKYLKKEELNNISPYWFYKFIFYYNFCGSSFTILSVDMVLHLLPVG